MSLPSLSPALPQLVLCTCKAMALDGSHEIALSEWDSSTLVHSEGHTQNVSRKKMKANKEDMGIF